MLRTPQWACYTMNSRQRVFFFFWKSVKQRHRLGRTATAGAIKMSETNLLRLHRCKGEDLRGAVGVVSQCARRREGARRRETQVNWVFNQHRKTSWTKWKTCSYKNLAWLKVKIIQRNHKFSSTERKKKNPKELTVTTRKQVSESKEVTNSDITDTILHQRRRK